jgi:hypothetical protein
MSASVYCGYFPESDECEDCPLELPNCPNVGNAKNEGRL